MDNPFKVMNDERIATGEQLVYPKLPRPKQIHAYLSMEALNGIQKISNKYADNKIPTLLELIGLGILQVIYTESITNEYTNLDSETCRQAGFEDAMNKEIENYSLLFPESNEFKDSYHKGYIEGMYTRENL